MSRRGSRISRRSMRSIPTARARPRRHSTDRWQKGEPHGTLDGVPATIKDNIATKGVAGAARRRQSSSWCRPQKMRRPPRGCAKPARSSSPKRRCRITACCRRAFPASIPSPAILGICRKNPGGSSAGAGAAGAAGYGPLHLGTDIGGSVRLPACWCGLVALKPSLGRIPIDPPYVGRVAGPMTRTVDDAALMMSVLSHAGSRATA